MKSQTSKKRQTHDILLTNEEKVNFFVRAVTERNRIKPFETEEELINYLRDVRRSFKFTYQRDVPGYFIRKIASLCGVNIQPSEKTKQKKNYAFMLMDRNENYRHNKTELIKALELKFGEKTLGYIVDDIWDEWHDRDKHPDPEINIDIYGQESLFNE